MTDPDLIELFVEPLDRLGVLYMVTGGVASVIYGDPRFTRDVDLVLALERSDIQRFASEFGDGDFYVPPLEALVEECARSTGGHFNVIHRDTGLRADIYLAGHDPLHVWAFERRQRIEVGSSGIWVAPVDYVVLRKLEYFKASGSERHVRDVAMILRISGDRLDHASFDRWVERLELREPLQRARHYDLGDS